MKYKVCPYCGANLDYGERCDCHEEERRRKSDQDNNLERDHVPSGHGCYVPVAIQQRSHSGSLKEEKLLVS